jgi:hypothetical protein
MADRKGQRRGGAPPRVQRQPVRQTAAVTYGKFEEGGPETFVWRTTRTLLITISLATLHSRACHAAAAIAEVETFIQAHCADCHNSATQEAGLDLTTLTFEPTDRSNLALWVRVHDRVSAREMPPEDQPRPTAAEVASLAASVGGAITEFEQATATREGRSVQRRLNRYEYENALRDLFAAPWLAIRDKLPPDGEAYHYNKVGESLDASHIQIARFMAAADYAMRQAMSASLERPEPSTRRYYARDEFSLRNFWPREGGTLPDRLSFPVLDGHAQPEVRAGREPASSAETRDREAVGKVSSTFSDAGGYSWGQFRAPVGGRYRLRFSGYTIWVGGGGIARWFYEGSGDEKAPVYHLPLWHRPELDEVWPGRGPEPIGVYASSSGQKRHLGEFDFTQEPTTHEVEVTLMPGETIQTDGSRLFRTRVNGTDEQYVNPLAQADGMPGYAVQWMEVEGPLKSETAGAGYRLLFGDLPMRRVEAGRRGVALEVIPQQNVERAGDVARGRGAPAGPGRGPGRRGGRPAAGGPGRGAGAPRPAPVIVEVVAEDPRQEGARLLRAFMEQAYRRPVAESHYERMLALFHDQLDKGFGFAKSLLAAYTAVLASPGFVFVQEQPGQLDDYALATRLALFLWNSPPDPELRRLADQGQLHDPAVLQNEAERLLDDPRATRFVEAFTDYWLDLRKLDDTSPSPTLYNDYELDDPLKLAAVAETRLFVAELFREDLPARNVVNSDFTFLNERLAQHYGIPAVVGVKMRRVALPRDSVRGGLMTQASILKITANGTTTSPVLRGHWITDRILGLETPPPPPVPAIEPDIRGAVTIRQQLERHRSDPSCASCHSKMDPPGFALESFDVMGGWRDRYRAVAEEAEPKQGVGMNGQAFAFHYALPVDCTGELTDGRAFVDVRELKRALLGDEAAIARNLARQLMVYATGAPVRFSDRGEIERILQSTAEREYGLRSLVLEIIQSDLFLNK